MCVMTADGTRVLTNNVRSVRTVRGLLAMVVNGMRIRLRTANFMRVMTVNSMQVIKTYSNVMNQQHACHDSHLIDAYRFHRARIYVLSLPHNHI